MATNFRYIITTQCVVSLFPISSEWKCNEVSFFDNPIYSVGMIQQLNKSLLIIDEVYCNKWRVDLFIQSDIFSKNNWNKTWEGPVKVIIVNRANNRPREKAWEVIRVISHKGERLIDNSTIWESSLKKRAKLLLTNTSKTMKIYFIIIFLSQLYQRFKKKNARHFFFS